MSTVHTQTNERGSSGQASATSADEALTGESLPARSAFLALVQQRLHACHAGTVRGAMIVVELDPHYVRRSAARIPEVLDAWSKRGGQAAHCGRIAEQRFALFVAPVGVGTRVQRLAEQLAHAIDPRICPSLRRALPFAWVGASQFPDDAADAGALLASAERDLEQRCRSGMRPRRDLRRRRRPATSFLRPLAAR